MPSSLRILITTFADKKAATSVVRTLVKEKLIACGTLFPEAHSIYHWQGAIEETSEVVVWMKTSQALLEACQQRLTELHPYDVPEVIVLEPSSVNLAYQVWAESALKRPGCDNAV